MTIQVRLGDSDPIHFDLEELTIDYTDVNAINKALSTQAGKFARVATLAAEARVLRESVEQTIKSLEAEADEKIRKAAGEKKPTEVQIKNAVSMDNDVKKAYQSLLSVRRDELLLSALLQAWSQKKDCLTSLANNLRQQYENTGGESF